MNAFSMSAIILGGLTLMMSILLLAQTPEAIHQAASLEFPLKAFRQQPLPPPVPFAIAAAVASLLAWKTKAGRYIAAVNMLLLTLVVALFI